MKNDNLDHKKKTIPVFEESVSIDKIKKETSEVIVQKNVEHTDEILEIPTKKEEIVIEHVPVGKIVDHYPAVREVDGKTIIPVVKEKLVVTKQLILEEEIHIEKKTSEQIKQIKETLRKDVVNIKKKNR